MIGEKISHYRILEKIGEGGMGVVYRAQDSRLHRDVALKVIADAYYRDAGHRARFAHEARMLAALDHPNVAAVHNLEVDRGRQILVMELVEGDTLSRRLEGGALPNGELLPIAWQVVDGLRAAHEVGIIHRDLKPSNIKITPQGKVKILDFGLAKMVAVPLDEATSRPSTVSTSEADSSIAGTIAYMAPEQIRGEPLDERSDIFTLGVVLYEMAVGRLPYNGASGAKLIGEIQHKDPVPPRWIRPDLPEGLETVMLRCLAKDPEARFGSMAAVQEALREAGTASGQERKTLAVLYFENQSPAQEDAYFRDGVTEDIIIELSRIRELGVLSRSSVLAFRDKPVAPSEVGRKLNASHVLEGTVRRVGNRLRISAQLVETHSARSIWAERYDRQIEDVFAIQDEIARNIAGALQVALSEEEKRALAKVPTADIDAYDYYLRGRRHLQQFRRKSIEFARELFGAAIEIDPAYAGAYAGLADCNSYLYMFWEASQEYLLGAETASRRAVELDPELAEAYVARGVAMSLGKEHEAAGREFERAIQLNPNQFEAYYFYGRGFYARGKFEEAVHWLRRACRARPEDYQSPMLAASALRGMGREKESLLACRESLILAQRHLELNPGDARALYFSAIALCHLGEGESRALKMAGRALAMDPEEPQVQYNVACVYALLDRPDEALGCLKAVIAHGEWWKIWMSNDPDLVSLHADPRFQELAAGAAA